MLNHSEQLRVCHVVLALHVGGLERVVIDLVRRSETLGQRPMIVCLGPEGALAADAKALGAEVINLNKRPGLRFGMIARLKALFGEWRPDVIHTHQIGALCYAGPAARLAGVPAVVHTEHGKHYRHSWRRRVLGRLSARFADRFFCVSSDLTEEIVECGVAPAHKVATVANGIDVDRYDRSPDDQLRASLGIPPGAPVVGTIGRLSEIKRQDVLLRAFAQLRVTHPAAHLLLVGDGEERVNLGSLAAELGIAAVTHFAGYRSNPEAFLPLMNVFALTSRSEGMPLAVLEAWSARVPVVASSVGGLPEMLADGRFGWLFPAGDHDALAAIVREVMASGGAAKVGGAYDLVRSKYSLDRVAAEYHGHYLAASRSSSGAPAVARVASA